MSRQDPDDRPLGTLPLFDRVLTAQAKLPEPDGETYERAIDRDRLGKQHREVFDLMSDGKARTLREIEDLTGYPQASVSARLRDFRKEKFGGHQLDRTRRGEGGTYEYRLTINDTSTTQRLPTV